MPPSSPGSPTSGSGTPQSGVPGDPTSGLPPLETSTQGQISDTGQDGTLQGQGLDIPAGGPLQTGGEILDDGTQESGESGEETEENEGSEVFGGELQGAEGEQADGGWEISNELPETGGNSASSQSDETGGGAIAALPEQGGGVGGEGDQELDRTLRGLDGEILNERAGEIDKANDRAAATGGPALMDEGGGAGMSDENDPINAEEPRQEQQPAKGGPNAQPNLPAKRNPIIDTPDARDDDIIARQLREAALEETDPELKERLWEEYRKYTQGRK